jgi:pimeloyl-ACP methyl ester carboxylesterase
LTHRVYTPVVSTASLARTEAGPLSGAPWTRHLSRLSGLHLHWAELGQGPAVILLHGLCDSHRTWHKVAPRLAPSHRVLMPDLPGHGLSDRPDAAYTVDWYAEVIGEWIQELGLESFDLVGHSFGGGVAQVLLVTHGHRVGRVALVAPGGLGRKVSLGLRLWSAAKPSELLTQPFIASSTRLGMSALLPAADPEEVAHLSWLNAMPGTARSLSRTVESAIDWRGQKQTFFDRAHELAVMPPLRLFWGDRDPNVPIEHAEEMVRRLSGVTLVRFDGCGHFPHQEQVDAFVDALSAFLSAPSAVEEPARILPEHVVVEPRPAAEVVAAPLHVPPPPPAPTAAEAVDEIPPTLPVPVPGPVPVLAMPWWRVFAAWVVRMIAWLGGRTMVGEASASARDRSPPSLGP